MSHSPVLLHSFQSQPPKHHSGQDSILEWIAAAHAQAEITLQKPATDEAQEAITRKYRKLVMRFGCSTDRIRSRNSALDDFTHTDWDRMRIFQLNEYPSGKPCGERSRFFREASGLAFDQFYSEEADPPPVLIRVTCTGYVSPSGAQRLVAKQDWGRATEVIHAYHMGCYASLPAIRMAAGCVERGKARVDIVHTELCTLHMDPTQHLPEHLVVQTLFADGVIRYSASRMGEGASVPNGRAKLDQVAPIATVDELPGYDAIIFGTPTRFGNMCAQMRNFLDQTGGLWLKGTLIGKVGSVFTSTATQHGGQETTITSFHSTLLHHGMILVGVPYSCQEIMNMSEITGGSPYGASTLAGGDGSRQPSENELKIARFQGSHVAQVAKKQSA